MLNEASILSNKTTIGDIARIRAFLKDDLHLVGLFGSVLWKPLSETNDIDIALFCNKNQMQFISKRLCHLDLLQPIRQIKFSYGGGGGDKVLLPINKSYDIVILDSANPDKRFMKINSNRMFEIPN